MKNVYKLGATVLASLLFLSLSEVAWCSDEIDTDAVNQHPQGTAPSPPSIRKFIDIQSKAQSAIADAEWVAIEQVRQRHIQEWQKRVAQMYEELATEMQRARADAALLKVIRLLDMATDFLRKAAESKAAWEAEAERPTREAQGGQTRSVNETEHLNGPVVRGITTKTIEVCTTREEPCRTVGVETLIQVWLVKDWKNDALGQGGEIRNIPGLEELSKHISISLKDEFPDGVICWGDGSKCESLSGGTSNSGVEPGKPLVGVEKLNGDGDPPEEALGSGSRITKASKRLAKLLWEVADWTTPVPDLIILITGENPFSGKKEGRMGAAMSTVIGLGGPVSKVSVKGSKFIIKGGKLFFGSNIWAKGNQKIVNAVIGNIHGRTGREVFGKLSPAIGANKEFAKLGHDGIRKALSRTPFIWERHAIVRMLERRTSKLGISTPNDIINILNSGTVLRAGGGMIAIQSPTVGAEIIVELGSRTVKTIRPLKPR